LLVVDQLRNQLQHNSTQDDVIRIEVDGGDFKK
jgi:hypothetical protein